ncbi:hypothetical protein Patl1_03376 [Pistacia atlantica]|uniref:Uncharacterized protein n=1 Tax=Pistacia atlantica TaxID=434234 RepID=A0ACC1CCQ3_9ROSI|nr:hypothetical protein Patl1_03376 [Pistacia atlantica]
MLGSMNNGEISISAYDTAWVALIEDTQGSGASQFPSALQWIVNNQLPDGSWGDAKIFSAHDRLINTLACVVALKSWKVSKRIPKDTMHNVPTTLLHSLEGMQDLNWEKLLKLQFQDGSFLFSLSSTAYAFMQTKNENCLKFLKKVVQRFNTGVPSTYPVDLFEHLWVVDRLQRLGILRYFQPELKECMDYVYRYWTEEGISWARNSRVQDIDDTAMGFRLLRLHGYEVSADVFQNFEKGGEFFCFGGQSTQAVTGIFNLFRASQVQFPGEKILENAKQFSAKFLREKLAANGLLDKWIITKDLPGEVSFALKVPWMPYVNNNIYLELAKLDYNNCQARHQIEWDSMQRWYKEWKLDNFGTSRRALLLAYFVAAASIYEPEKWQARIGWAKTAVLLETITSYFHNTKHSREKREAFVDEFRNCISINNLSQLRLESDIIEQGFTRILLGTLDHLSLDALVNQGRDISHPLHQAYRQLSDLTNRICSKLGHYQKQKVHDNGSNNDNNDSIRTLQIESEMQELLQLVLKHSSDDIDSNVKHTFLIVAKSFYYTAYCNTETINFDIDKVFGRPALKANEFTPTFAQDAVTAVLHRKITSKMCCTMTYLPVADIEEDALKASLPNEIKERVHIIRSMLSSLNDGEISISAYDTAWVALIEDIQGSGAPQFPSTLQWIANNQLPDGSWGDADIFSAYDRLISTLACVVALKTWNIHHDKCEKVPSVYPVDLFERLWVVDRLQRLGISRYFQRQFKECTEYVYRYWTEEGISSGRNGRVHDIDDTSMGFRLLRLHGYEVSADVFQHFKKGGEFFCYYGQSTEAVTPIYNLYRASQVLFPGEKILENAKQFSAKFLREKLVANKLLDKWIIAKDLPGEVRFALEVPWYASLPRVEARLMLYVNNNIYLELAKLDYNNCQALHQTEWDNMQRRWGSSKIEQGLTRIFLGTLKHVSKDALAAQGRDISHHLHQAWEKWLLKWQEEGERNQEEAELLVRTIHLIGGHPFSDELLHHPQYRRLTELTNRICYKLGNYQKQKVRDNGSHNDNSDSITNLKLSPKCKSLCTVFLFKFSVFCSGIWFNCRCVFCFWILLTVVFSILESGSAGV